MSGKRVVAKVLSRDRRSRSPEPTDENVVAILAIPVVGIRLAGVVGPATVERVAAPAADDETVGLSTGKSVAQGRPDHLTAGACQRASKPKEAGASTPDIFKPCKAQCAFRPVGDCPARDRAGDVIRGRGGGKVELRGVCGIECVLYILLVVERHRSAESSLDRTTKTTSVVECKRIVAAATDNIFDTDADGDIEITEPESADVGTQKVCPAEFSIRPVEICRRRLVEWIESGNKRDAGADINAKIGNLPRLRVLIQCGDVVKTDREDCDVEVLKDVREIQRIFWHKPIDRGINRPASRTDR